MTGWLGKPHAMALAARYARTDYLLFTDADVLFDATAIRLSLANAVATHADHLVLLPTTAIHRWDEAAMLSFMQIFSLWAARPWRIADPKAKRDAIGIDTEGRSVRMGHEVLLFPCGVRFRGRRCAPCRSAAVHRVSRRARRGR